MSAKVRRVVVVGRDAPVWLTASAILRAVGRAQVAVEVVELPSLLSPVDAYAALPSLQALHQLLGLDESLVIAAGRGVPMVGQRYANWSGSAPPFVHAYDSTPPPGGDLDFVHYWTKARLEGLKVPLEEFSLGAMAARLGKVPVAGGSQGSLAAAYGYHLDARGYSGLIKQLAAHLGVTACSSAIADVALGEGRIESILLANGRVIEGDLFVDVSGPEALLLSRMEGASFESWDQSFTCNRILNASAPAMSPLPALSQISAMKAGWIGLFPLQDRTAVIAAYNAEQISEAELLSELPLLAGVKVTGEAIVSPHRSGAQTAAWIGNCVAVGEAAFSLEPLDAIHLYLPHVCVSNFITLFPVESRSFPEAAFYNAKVRKFADNLRAFQEAHYKLNRRFGEPMWDRARDPAASETLARKAKMFHLRGDTVPADHETFEPSSWTSIFVGHGSLPEGYDPRVDLIGQQDHIRSVQGRLREIGSAVPSFPTVDEFLNSNRVPIEPAATTS